jgi:hypothetical protein
MGFIIPRKNGPGRSVITQQKVCHAFQTLSKKKEDHRMSASPDPAPVALVQVGNLMLQAGLSAVNVILNPLFARVQIYER